MEKIFEGLIDRLKKEKKESEKRIFELKSDKNDLLLFLFTGKILAYDQCIEEIKKTIEYCYNNSNKSNQ